MSEGVEDMMNFVRLLKDQAGASAAEYALILAIIGTAIAAAALSLGDAISTSMTGAAKCISAAENCPDDGAAAAAAGAENP
jgi:pilus assembly protein Flp/PilA